MTDTLVVLGLLAVFVFCLGVWTLFRRGWMSGFFISLTGLWTLALAAVLVTVRLLTYEPLTDGRVNG